MRRLFYKGRIADEIFVTGEDAAHIMYASRAKKGERLTVVDDVNQAALMEMTSFSPDKVTLKLIERLPLSAPGACSLILAQCLLKGDKTDFLVQKATELGATRFVPLISRNTVIRLTGEKAATKVKRWQKIAVEAAQQCGGNILAIDNVTSLADFLTSKPPNALFVFCHENEQETSLRQILQKTGDADEIILLIGPEGGFTLDEAAAIIKAGGKAVTLGRRILRAETAALVALTAVQYDKGEL